MNLVKELHKIAATNLEKEKAETQVILDSVKANLQMEDAEDQKMLIYFGTNQTATASSQKQKALEKINAHEFLREDDIKKVCLRYGFRFLPSGYYKKEIPIHALHDLRAFKERNNISEIQLSHFLYVIAPKSHFELGPRPPKDPVLIYHNTQTATYQVVSTWGDDFTFLRRIYGFFFSNFIKLITVSIIVIPNIIYSILVLNHKVDETIFLCNLFDLVPFGFMGFLHSENKFLEHIDLWDVPHV